MKNFIKNTPATIIVLGVILRLREYVYNRSLWVDEALLVNNIIERSYVGLLGTLGIDQHAPIGFLWVERVMYLLFGRSEYVFRLFPLICGIISLFLFKKLVDRIMPEMYARLALLLFAVSDVLIRYSSELKQYSIEVLVQLVLYLLFTKYSLSGLLEKKWKLMLLIGPLALLFSHTAILTLAAFSMIYIVQLVYSKETKKAVFQGGLSMVWIASFGVLYLGDALHAYSDPAFVSAWIYFKLIPTSLYDLLTNAIGFYNISFELLGPISTLIGMGLFLLGAVHWCKRDRTTSLLFLLPIILGLIASGLEKYPFVTRVFLFSVPAMILFIFKGFEWLVEKFPVNFKKKAKLFLAGFLFVGSVYTGTVYFFHPREIEAIKPVLKTVLSNRSADDGIYIFYASEAAFKYYLPRLGLKDDQYHIGVMSRNKPLEYLTDINKYVGDKKTVWFIFSHNIMVTETPMGRLSEEEYIVNYLNKKGKLERNLNLIGASVYEYSFTK